jgi:hypothetical protein
LDLDGKPKPKENLKIQKNPNPNPNIFFFSIFKFKIQLKSTFFFNFSTNFLYEKIIQLNLKFKNAKKIGWGSGLDFGFHKFFDFFGVLGFSSKNPIQKPNFFFVRSSASNR